MTLVAAVLSLVMLMALSVGSAGATVPCINIFANDLRSMLEVPFYEDVNGVYRVDDWRYSNSEYSIHLHDIVMDPDPSISYGIGVVDLGAPSTFTFVFGTPIVPVGSPNTVSGSIAGGLTDFEGDGVSLTPTGSKVQASEVSGPSTNMGVDVGDAFSAGSGSPGALYTYGAFSSGLLSGPGPGPWTFLSTTVSFTLSGGTDTAALTGFTSIVEGEVPAPVPEPSSLALVAGGLVSLAVLVRRRRGRERPEVSLP